MILNWLKYDLPLGLLLILPAAVFLQTTGDVSAYFCYQVPAGQVCYLASKVCGLYAIVFLWLQLLQGLLNDYGYNYRQSLGEKSMGLGASIVMDCFFSGIFSQLFDWQ